MSARFFGGHRDDSTVAPDIHGQNFAGGFLDDSLNGGLEHQSSLFERPLKDA
jgi:hypothetical protein